MGWQQGAWGKELGSQIGGRKGWNTAHEHNPDCRAERRRSMHSLPVNGMKMYLLTKKQGTHARSQRKQVKRCYNVLSSVSPKTLLLVCKRTILHSDDLYPFNQLPEKFGSSTFKSILITINILQIH